MNKDCGEPVYTIGIISRLLKVCPATLRIWERKNLIKPARIGKNRFYSKNDLDRLEQIKELLQKKHINIEGVRKVLEAKKCWDIKKCGSAERDICPVYREIKHA